MGLHDTTSIEIAKLLTNRYSTSFSFATSLMSKEKRSAIYSIYGFVRIADEIVDTFHDHDKSFLLDKLEDDLKTALDKKISVNPILHAFQLTVYRYNIPYEYIDAFMTSMRFDLEKKMYSTKIETDTYIYGSADVVGLMCLKVFCNNTPELFYKLEKPAMRLGSAFQKVNFLRDLKNDAEHLGRSYFHNFDYHNFTEESKAAIIAEIESDFKAALEGIVQLPTDAKIAVSVAYYYYLGLLKKLKNTSPQQLLSMRVRISNFRKLLIMFRVVILGKLNLL
jgi:15-cis-phytoene synthase